MKKKKTKDLKIDLEFPEYQKEQVSIKETLSKTPNIPLRLYDPLKRRSKFSIRYWKDKIKDKYFPDRSVLVNLELTNGMHRLFLVLEKDNGFKYRGMKYIFDNQYKYYNIDCRLYIYDFHEEFALPIQRKIPVNELKKTLESSNLTQVEYATNPKTLDRFIVSKIAEGIMKGQAIDSWLRQVRLIVIIIGIVCLIHLVLFMQKSGMFAQIKMPF